MSTNDEIRVLMETTGQKASYMTNALKNIGGDMQSGIKQLGTLLRKEGFAEGIQIGKRMGERTGMIKGSFFTLAVVGVIGTCYWLYDIYETKKTIKTVMSACDASDSCTDSMAVESNSVDLADIDETESCDSEPLD